MSWIAAWLFVFGATGMLYGWLICSGTDGALLTSLVAGTWAGWFVAAKSPPKVGKEDLYYPMPREYKLPLKEIFSRISDVFADSVYNYGDKWHPSTEDTEAKKIIADLRIKDKNTKKFVKAEVAFTDIDDDTTTVRFQFEAQDDNWLEWRPCSEIIEKFMQEVKLQIGEGVVPQELRKTENPDKQTKRKMPAPPWALIGLSALCVVFLVKDIIRELLK